METESSLRCHFLQSSACAISVPDASRFLFIFLVHFCELDYVFPGLSDKNRHHLLKTYYVLGIHRNW